MADVFRYNRRCDIIAGGWTLRVVVTGSSGLAGRFVVEHLVDHGYHVTGVDRIRPDRELAQYRLADVEDLGQVFDCLAGAEAVVHLAAIPRPGFEPDAMVFRTNVMSTYNVLEAAARLDIRRVVLASSISVLGYPFHYRAFSPQYVPIDEVHPRLPQDPYALSKVVGEELADGFVRRTGMTVISLRLAWIHTPQTFEQQLAPMHDDPAAGASNLWSYIDTRDAAGACRLALEADLTGHEAMFVAAPDSFMPQPTAELVRQVYPDTEIRAGVEGRASPISSAKARRLLGYRAGHTWESYAVK